MPQIDHIINLVPHSTLQNLPSSVTSRFTIHPGLQGAETSNKLVVFRDGSMLEFTAFVDDDPAHKSGHFWGALPNGTIDYAFASPGEDIEDAEEWVKLTRRALREHNTSVTYAESREGTRGLPSGETMEYQASFPEGKDSAARALLGGLPFWQHGLTGQERRVPVDSREATTHPSGAVGLKELVIGVPKDRTSEFTRIYQALTGQMREREFTVETPFGEHVDITLEPFDEKNARITEIKLWTEKQGVSALDEVFGSGNPAKLGFVPLGAARL